jgi:hypothetical protein
MRALIASLTATLVFSACGSARGASAPAAEVRELLRQPFPEKPGTDVVTLEVIYPQVAPRRHMNIQDMFTCMCLLAP